MLIGSWPSGIVGLVPVVVVLFVAARRSSNARKRSAISVSSRRAKPSAVMVATTG